MSSGTNPDSATSKLLRSRRRVQFIVALVVLPCLGLAIYGYTRDTRTYTKITVTYPGATPQIVEAQIAVPIEFATAGIPLLNDTISISSRGQAEFYLIWDNRPDSTILHDRLSLLIEDWPRRAGTPVVEQVAEAPAARPDKTVAPMVLVLPNKSAMQQHHLEHQDVMNAAMTAFSETDDVEQQLARVVQVRIKTDSGDVPLTEIATVEIVDSPISIVRRNGRRVDSEVRPSWDLKTAVQ